MKKIFFSFISIIIIFITLANLNIVNATQIQSGDVLNGYQYFIVENSNADTSRMRIPYIEDVTPNYQTNFYDSTIGEEGDKLKSTLYNITDGSYNTSYDWSRFDYCDEDPNNSSNIWTIYGSQSLSKSAHVSGANTWNREHTYPQSFFNKKAPMVADTNHIFADDWKTNGVRSSKKYGDIDNSTDNEVYDSANKLTANFSNNTYFEPMDAVKGQVARATLYMYVRYNLDITTNFQTLNLCLEWNNNYPVTTWEIERNNRVSTVQHNRNPFIDHPEFANLLFGLDPIDTNDQDKINEVISNINELPTNIALSDEEQVNSVKSLYNNLTASEKKEVSNYSILTSALERIVYLKDNPEIPDTFENRFASLQTKALLEVNYNAEETVVDSGTNYEEENVNLETQTTSSEFSDSIFPAVLNTTESNKYYYNQSSNEIKGIKLGTSKVSGQIVLDFPETQKTYENITVNLSPWQSSGKLSGAVEKGTVEVSVTDNDGSIINKSIALVSKDIENLEIPLYTTIKKIKISVISGKRCFVHGYTLNKNNGPISKTNYHINSSKLKFGIFDLTQEFYDLSLSGEASFGIIFSKDNISYTNTTGSINDFQTKHITTHIVAFSSNEMALSEDNTYQFSVALNYKKNGIEQFSKYGTLIYATVYMEYEGNLFFITSSSNSINSLASKYESEYKNNSMVMKHIGMLNELKNYRGEHNE